MTPLTDLTHALRRRADLARSRVGARPPVCEDVKAWAALRPGIECRTLLPAKQVTHNLPRTIEPKIHREFVERQRESHREKYLVRLAGAQVLGENGVIVLPDGNYSSESVFTRSILEQDPAYFRRRRRRRITKSGNYFSLLVMWSKGNYYHWLHDTLQRLYGVADCLPQDTMFIVPADLKPFQISSLRAIGIPDERLVAFKSNEVWDVEALYFSNYTTHAGWHRSDVDEWLRNTILEGCHVLPQGGGRRILVSRRFSTRRRIVNELELERYLHERGFETCIPEEMSFEGQVELFSEASVVVSAHGAALANVLFAPRHSTLIEIIPPSMMRMAHIYWAMSDGLGHDYWYFVAEDVDGGTYVPMEKVAATLDEVPALT